MDLVDRIDIGAAIDGRPWSGIGLAATLLVATGIVFDGMNNQLLGLIGPTLIAEFGIDRNMLAVILAAGLGAMAAGTVAGGWLGDRIGRRPVIILSVALFGLATIVMSFAETVGSLIGCRLVAGLGLGALLPNGTALIAEYVPARLRSMVVMLAMACVPLGAIAAALVSGSLLDLHGWRPLAQLSGALPIVLAVVMIPCLPESPRFLACKPSHRARLDAVLRRIGIALPHGAAIAGVDIANGGKSSGILGEGRARDALALFVAFFFSMLSSYSLLSWLPSALAQLGLDTQLRGTAVATFNFGGIVGAFVGSIVINQLGSRRPMLALCIFAAIASAVLAGMPAMSAIDATALVVLLAVQAAMLGVVQTALYSLAAHLFPALVRATGVGMAVGLGRGGAMASSFTGALALDLGGAPAFFSSIALIMVVTFLALAMIVRHIPPSRELVPAGARSERH